MAELLGALGVQVGHYGCPLTAGVGVRGELGEQGGARPLKIAKSER